MVGSVLVLPGSLATANSRFLEENHSDNKFTCVVLPDPSIPSSAKNGPRFFFASLRSVTLIIFPAEVSELILTCQPT